MLSRYTMYRGPRPAHDPMPEGIRQDTRKHTRHCLRPPSKLVIDFLADPSEVAWQRLARDYRAELERRFSEERKPFDALADLAAREDVFLGCSCPTAKNPVPEHCHTWLAITFMKEKYPRLEVRLPQLKQRSGGTGSAKKSKRR